MPQSAEPHPNDPSTARSGARSPGTRAGLAAAAAVAVGLVATACAGTSTTTSGPGVRGAGATTQGPVTTAWQGDFESRTGGSFEYDPVGSGTGIDMFFAGAVDFAGSDYYLSDEEIAVSKSSCAGSLGAVNVPTYLSSVGLVYNLPSLGGEQLNLSADAIAGIFAGDITNWSDPAIAGDNPDLDLPDRKIVPVHRYDSSGTTKNFTEYLDAAAPGAWTYGTFSNWSLDGPAGESAPFSGGAASVVASAEGSIGYVDVAQAGGLPVAAVEAGDGFVLPTDASVSEAFENAAQVYPNTALDFAFDFDRTPESATEYPLAMVSYTVVCLDYEDAKTADLVSSYLDFIQSDDAQHAAARAAGAIPLDPTTVKRVGAVANSIGVVTA